MIYVRDFILTLTLLALVAIAADQHKPPKTDAPPESAAYCVIDYKAARKHPLTGELETGWARGYGPCSLQDKYFQI